MRPPAGLSQRTVETSNTNKRRIQMPEAKPAVVERSGTLDAFSLITHRENSAALVECGLVECV
jgi:hypothetical protein